MAQFHRVDTDELIRGAARIMYAPITQPKPLKIEDVINLTDETDEVQTVTITGTPTGGTFKLEFSHFDTTEETAAIAYNATSGAVESALEALPNIGVGNVTVTGGPGPGTPYVVTFAGVLGAQNVEMLVVSDNSLTGGTSPDVTVAETTPGEGLYDPQAGWVDLGGTREGIQITINNTEDAFDIDQIAGDVGAAPTSWEVMVATRLAENTLENFQLIWEGSDITLDTSPTSGDEREVGFAGATSYTRRRLAILFQKPDGKIRGYFFHKVVRAPQEGTLDHRKGGEAMSVQIQFKALADETVQDVKKQFFIMRDQV